MTEKGWFFGGAGLLFFVSLSMRLFGIPNILTPYPMPLFIVAIMGGKYIFPFITPLLYMLVIKIFSNSRHFSKVVIILILVFAFLNFYHFLNTWDLGVKYRSYEYAQFIAIENIVGFFIALTMGIAGHIKKSRRLILGANLTLFILLSWCAFPYLGEIL
ncbi:hypothetical protein WH95_01500 [Kiloniella litopenaei]|uniref:Uncharacterized protein n=1 Tax=Kiloniella litopenaei TaxID=1549748 RepID=A0A0M2RFH0_9PROT|nr:hypothetical protein [Kiloniella litopenaei]KKJ78770.1 hypothetical protein WH95_01500 [Kiloniella litopenaei]